MSWVEVDGAGWRLKLAGWRWMELGGVGWSWVEVDARSSNTHIFPYDVSEKFLKGNTVLSNLTG